jgi:hypothetical protein
MASNAGGTGLSPRKPTTTRLANRATTRGRKPCHDRQGVEASGRHYVRMTTALLSRPLKVVELNVGSRIHARLNSNH